MVERNVCTVSKNNFFERSFLFALMYICVGEYFPLAYFLFLFLPLANELESFVASHNTASVDGKSPIEPAIPIETV